MAETNSVLKFPSGKPSKKEAIQESIAVPSMDSYSYEDTVDLYQIAGSVKRKSEELTKFVDENRAVARSSGIEILAVQVGSILEGEKFQRVMDALEDGVYRKGAVSLTRDGVEKIHRLEKLTADADQIIIGFMNGKKPESMLGQSTSPFPAYPAYPIPFMQAPHANSDMSAWMPIIIFGIAGIVGVIAILALTQRSKSA